MTDSKPKRIIRPYGDRMDDGVVQISFVLPVPPSEKAKEAARVFMKKMGFSDVKLATMEHVADNYSFFIAYGRSGMYLDYNEIVEGTTVMLPVYHPGALLFIGDGHALQADGEPVGTGVETSMDVGFTVELRRKASLTGPRAETAEHIISIGSQPEFASSLDRGLQMAATDMAQWLVAEYGLEPWAAHLLIGYQGRFDVVTVAGSMALRIPKRYLPPRR